LIEEKRKNNPRQASIVRITGDRAAVGNPPALL
jgi:hypothetical protein